MATINTHRSLVSSKLQKIYNFTQENSIDCSTETKNIPPKNIFVFESQFSLWAAHCFSQPGEKQWL